MADFDLPEPVLEVLPSDPFEQLDIARKITSIALATRVSKLESESAQLRQSLAQKEAEAAQLAAQVEALDASLADLSNSLARAQQEKAALLDENAALSNTVNKLNRDVSKLEVFKKTLMQSLQDQDENTQLKAPKMVSREVINTSLTTESNQGDEAPTESQVSESGSSVSEDGGGLSDIDASKQGIPYHLRLPSLSSTPRLTPPDSPPRLTAALSPPKVSKPLSPTRRHSISVASARNMYNGRSSVFSSMPSSHQSLMTSPFDTGAQTGRTRVDGKEFFRQVRSRLSYEQFTSFLANVKELNSHKQTREETLSKAEDIFGPDNKDLYTIFEGLITRNLH